MEGTDGGDTRVKEQRRTFRDPANGREWVLAVTGRSTSGVLPLRIIPLMEVTFALAENPEVSVRRALCQGGTLDGLADDEVLGLFRRSRPCRTPGRRGRG